jgi:hypothetical protein
METNNNTTTQTITTTIIGRTLPMLAKRCALTEQRLKEHILEALHDHLGTEDEDEFIGATWGLTIAEILRDYKLDVPRDILYRIGVTKPTFAELSLLTSLQLMGTGKCPVCGGDVYFYEGKYHHENASWDAPASSTLIAAVWRCTVCDSYFATDSEEDFDPEEAELLHNVDAFLHPMTAADLRECLDDEISY